MFDFKATDGTSKKFKQFKHPVHLIVFYTEADITNAGGEDKLVLGLHDGTKWTPFKVKDPKDKKPDEKDDDADKKTRDPWKGYVKITIKDWKDPAVGWGP
jgi:hypothetical protein